MTSMKGLLKGLRYISQIFDNEKEEEIQIGFPTDVKHVAHIGMDGPSANTPSWMNEFKPSSGVSSVSSNNEPKDKHPSKSSEPLTQDIMDPPKLSGASLDSPTRRNSSKKKQSRRNHSSSAGSIGSPTGDSSGTSKPRSHKNSIDLDSSTRGSSTTSKPRRRKNSTDLDSPTGDSSTRSRRSQHLNIESDSPSHDPPGVPKQSRRKKSKGSSSGGLSKSSRSKGSDHSTESYPDSGLGHGSKDDSLGPNSVLEVYEEGNECDELSRGIRAL